MCTDRWAHQAKSAKRDPRHKMKNNKDNVRERKQAARRLNKVALDVSMTQSRLENMGDDHKDLSSQGEGVNYSGNKAETQNSYRKTS